MSARKLLLLTVLLINIGPEFKQQLFATSLAQSPTIQVIARGERIVYTERIMFSLEIASPSPLVSAEIAISLGNEPTEITVSVPVVEVLEEKFNHSVPVSDLRLPPFARIQYHWNFVLADGTIASTDNSSFFYLDTSVPWQWKEARQGNIVVYSDGRDSDLVEKIVTDAEDFSRSASDLTGIDRAGELSIIVYPDLASFMGTLAKNRVGISDWVAAYSIPDQGVVIIASPSQSQEWTQTSNELAHEMAHVYLHESSSQNALPGWFEEGTALTLEPNADQTLARELSAAVQDGVLLSVETLCVSDFAMLPPQDRVLAYAQSHSLIKYVLVRYGVSQLHAMRQVYRNGISCAEGVQTVLGISLAQLEAQWHQSLSAEGLNTYSEFGPGPWIVWGTISMFVASLFFWPQATTFNSTLTNLTKASLSKTHE
jgi:hypothetical protein